MAVKIRLARRGRKKRAMYDVVIADARSPRDGRFIEKIGTYNPNTNPATINLDDDKALDWILKGAQPTDTMRAILSYRGVMLRKHLQVGVRKGAITQEQADAKFEAWKQEKATQIQGKVDTLAKKKADEKKAKLDAETKIKEEREKAIAERKAAVEAEEKAKEEAEKATEEEVADDQKAVEEATDDQKVVEKAADDQKTAEEAPATEKTEETPAAEATSDSEEEKKTEEKE
ncbi:MAG: 30S ribosomal protein S16 [Thermonemataceae bacterium]